MVAVRDGFEVRVRGVRPGRVEVEVLVGPPRALLQLASLLVRMLVLRPGDSAARRVQLRRWLKERVRVLMLVEEEHPRGVYDGGTADEAR